MIARLRGRSVASTPEGLVIDVGGGGYPLAATPTPVCQAGDAPERELFVQLLSVNGVGPKVALSIVSGSPVAELRRAIALEDAARFQAIPGIGKKTAERIVLELKGAVAEAIAPTGWGAEGGDHGVAREALVELGFSPADAERALAEIGEELPAEERVRLALKRAA